MTTIKEKENDKINISPRKVSVSTANLIKCISTPHH